MKTRIIFRVWVIQIFSVRILKLLLKTGIGINLEVSKSQNSLSHYVTVSADLSDVNWWDSLAEIALSV